VKYYFRKSKLSLVPADDKAIKKISKIAINDIVSVDIKQVRSYPQLKRFFKFVQITFEMQDHFTEKEAYRRWLAIKAGYYTTIVYPDGTVVLDSDSIAFDNMEEAEFIKLFNSCINVFLTEFGTGVTEDELNTVVRF